MRLGRRCARLRVAELLLRRGERRGDLVGAELGARLRPAGEQRIGRRDAAVDGIEVAQREQRRLEGERVVLGAHCRRRVRNRLLWRQLGVVG